MLDVSVQIKGDNLLSAVQAKQMSQIAALGKAFTAQFAIFVVLATCVADFGMKPRRTRLREQPVQVRTAYNLQASHS